MGCWLILHLHGDIFRRMIVSGREEMTDRAGEEAFRQLYLRCRLAATAARQYCEGGFTVIVQDNYLGKALGDFVDMLKGCTVYVVALCPSVATVERREAQRGKKGYTGFDVAGLHSMFMAETPRLGLWLDTSDLTPEQTVDEILNRTGEAQVY